MHPTTSGEYFQNQFWSQSIQ